MVSFVSDMDFPAGVVEKAYLGVPNEGKGAFTARNIRAGMELGRLNQPEYWNVV